MTQTLTPFQVHAVQRVPDYTDVGCQFAPPDAEPGLILVENGEAKNLEALAIATRNPSGTWAALLFGEFHPSLTDATTLQIRLKVRVLQGEVRLQAICRDADNPVGDPTAETVARLTMASQPNDRGFYIADQAYLNPAEHVQECEFLIEHAAEFDSLAIENWGGAASLVITAISVSSIPQDNDAFALAAPGFDDTLFVFYDLRRDGLGYDFMNSCYYYEMLRLDLQLKHIFMVIVPKSNEDYDTSPQYRSVMGGSALQWRISNLLIGVMDLYPSIRGHCIALNKYHALQIAKTARHRFPKKFDVHHIHLGDRNVLFTRQIYERLGKIPGYEWPRAPEHARELVERWLARWAPGKRPVVITLRQQDYDVARNSDMAAWAAFIDWLPDEYCPVIVPDTDKLYVTEQISPGRAIYFDEASLNVSIRMAIYEAAYLNLFVNTGPNVMVRTSQHIPYVYFKPADLSNTTVSATLDWLARLGQPIFGTPSFASPNQKWVWENDTFEVIQREFQLMCDVIGNGA